MSSSGVILEMSSGKLDVLVPRPPTAVRLPVPLITGISPELDALDSSSMGPASSVVTGEVGGCEGVGGISVGIGASVGDETSFGPRGAGGTGGAGGALLGDRIRRCCSSSYGLRVAQPCPGISIQAAGVTGGGTLGELGSSAAG